MKIAVMVFSVLIFLSSCKTGNNAFGKKSFHEQYGKKLTDAGLEGAHLGRLWFQAATEALNRPEKITLPVRQVGYFPADRPEAIGLLFEAKRGQKLMFQVTKNPRSGFTIYGEIWKVNATGERDLEFAADTASGDFNFEVEESGSYIFRMQPELLQSGDYTLVISIGPSLKFPVAGNAKIGSLWGAPRDGGTRSHEGIDIFAPKGTPVLATSDGSVARVTENNIGGKVVFLRPEGKNFSVYYAHLAQQLVSSGQKVRAGDTIGLVGNTGNAKTTPPHLHLGIYTGGGAIDPLVFVDPVVKKPGTLGVTGKDFLTEHRLVRDVKLASGRVLTKNSLVRPLAENTEFVVVRTIDGQKERLFRGVIQSATKELSTQSISDSAYVYELPDIKSPRVGKVAPGKIPVLAVESNFVFVRSGALEGWIMKR